MRLLRNFDVSSYYPSLMIMNGYSSRNIPSFEEFEQVYHRRIAAKKAGDKATANSLKLVLNTTYGATLNQYNDLYDPLQARSVCISGQLYLLELANHLLADIPGLRIVQLNTDGIMIEFDENQHDAVLAITDEWQQRTGFGLEEDVVERIYQKDVNNYVEVSSEGMKTKGGYLVRGISTAGAFKVNNNACIVAKAIEEYFVHGTPPEDTINSCNDISQFQLIAKAGSKYREAYWLVDGEKREVQKVNRVYAVADERYGKLYKVKAENDAEAKIESLPEHCYIDNSAVDDPNHLSVDSLDRQWYIDVAQKRINDFKGIQPEKKGRKKMATTTKTPTVQNVYQKLNAARLKFLEANVEKSGKNNHLQFHYFELEDIVPVAQPIFNELGLFAKPDFTQENARMTVINAEKPEETVTFEAPFDRIRPIVSNAGKQATNEMQALGASLTYMRRYLWMIALDITEHDDIDANAGLPEPAPKPAVQMPPATPEERAEIKQTLTNAEGPADALQLNQLKDQMKKLRKNKPAEEEWIAKIALQTKGFTEIRKSDCAKILEKVAEKLEAKE